MHTYLIAVLLCSTTLSAQIEYWNDSTGLIPLTDLGTNYYENIQGGLYANGVNELSGKHKKNGILLAQALTPLDTAGNIDYINGEIIILGLGASVASNAYNAYLDSLHFYEWEGVNDCLGLKGMFAGGKDLTMMTDLENPTYWNNIRLRMADRGDTHAQVQLIWLLQNSDADTTSIYLDYFNAVLDKYIDLMQILKDTFPNLKQVYISSMHFGGYTDSSHVRFDALHEPRAYWNGLVIKELINKQISGDPALKYTGIKPQAAWMCWGPYFWADGKNARTYDSLSWNCDQFREDEVGGGFHLEDTANAVGIEAQMLWDFFTTDPVASIWHNQGDLWSGCAEAKLAETLITSNHHDLYIFPNPVHAGSFEIRMPQEPVDDFQLMITDMSGKQLTNYSIEKESGTALSLHHDLPSGMYVIHIRSEWQLWNGVMVVVR